MIKQFKAKNFKNFNEEITFDLTNSRDYAWNESLVKDGLINKAIIYGENNSGKSNLGAAIMDITTHLSDNFHINRLYNHYSNGNSIDNDVSFYYDFVFDKKNVTYKYRKDKTRHLLDEELICDNEILFKYNYTNNKYENKIQGAETMDLSKRNMEVSMLKYVYRTLQYIEDGNPIKQLFNFVDNMLWFRCLRENEFMGLMPDGESIDDYIIKNGALKDFEKFLSDMNQNYDLIELENAGRRVIGVKYKNSVAPFFDVCSTGTNSLILFYYWMKHTENLKFLYLDEFDAFYHFELSYNIVKYIKDNPKYQAILTTHNINLLDNELLRPNCYYVIKDGKISSIDRRTTKIIRETHNLEKMYLGGEFVN